MKNPPKNRKIFVLTDYKFQRHTETHFTSMTWRSELSEWIEMHAFGMFKYQVKLPMLTALREDYHKAKFTDCQSEQVL